MDRVVFLSGVLPGQVEDDLGPAGVFLEEIGDLNGQYRMALGWMGGVAYIVDSAVENDPAAVSGAVLLDCRGWGGLASSGKGVTEPTLTGIEDPRHDDRI